MGHISSLSVCIHTVCPCTLLQCDQLALYTYWQHKWQTNTPTKRRHPQTNTHKDTQQKQSNPLRKFQPWKNKNYYILWDRHQIIVGPCCQDNNREKLFKWQNDIGCSKSRGFSPSSFPVPKAKSVLLSKQKSSFGNVFLLNWTDTNIICITFSYTHWGKAQLHQLFSYI